MRNRNVGCTNKKPRFAGNAGRVDIAILNRWGVQRSLHQRQAEGAQRLRLARRRLDRVTVMVDDDHPQAGADHNPVAESAVEKWRSTRQRAGRQRSSGDDVKEDQPQPEKGRDIATPTPSRSVS